MHIYKLLLSMCVCWAGGERNTRI